ncbi:MAG: PDZ domain-containing protein [Pirellulaceae bacterium]
MRRSISLAVFALFVAAALPAQAQLLKKLEETLKKAVPAVGAPAPAAAPKPMATPEDGELPPPAPDAGKDQPGYLGIEGDSDPEGGVRVDGFKEIGKARTSGLKVGDRIIAINGKKVQDADEFGMLMDGKKTGETVTLKVNRNGKEQDFKVTLVDPPAAAAEPTEGPDVLPPGVVVPPGAGGPLVAPRSTPAPGRASLGITVITLTEELRARLGVPVRRGAVVTMVRPASPADRAGIPVDAVVVSMDGTMIASSEELVALIRDTKPGTEAELTYYVGEKLARKSVKLAPATVISTLPPGYGSEPPLNLGAPGAERPLLSKVEKVISGLTNTVPAPAANAADIVALQQSYSNMQAQMKLLVERIDELEARVKSLEAVAAPKLKDDETPKPKLGAPKPKVEPPFPNGPNS